MRIDCACQRNRRRAQLEIALVNLDYVIGQVIGNVIVQRDRVADIHVVNARILNLYRAIGSQLAARIFYFGIAGDHRVNSVERLRVQKLLRRAGGNLVQTQRAVKWRIQHVSFFDWAALAFQPDCLLAFAGKMRRELHAELLVGSEIIDIEIDVVVNGAATGAFANR